MALTAAIVCRLDMSQVLAEINLAAFSVASYGGQAFLEDGKEYLNYAELYQNAGTMDYSPSAAGTARKYRIRMQVDGDDIHIK